VIVVLLVVIWGIALVPVTVRWLSERQLATSVARFMAARRILRQTYPPLVVVSSGRDLPVRVEQVRIGARTEQERRIRRQQAQLRIERRRRTLATLGGGTVAVALVGAVPRLHMLWDVAFAGFVLTLTYVGLLVRLARGEMAARHRSLLTTPRTAEASTAERELLVANARFRPEQARVAARPAFVLVEAPS